MKQQKYEAITMMLDVSGEMRCLDIGGDNGVISYLLRQRGGRWSSVDVDVESIRELVGTEAYAIDGAELPFADATFDRVVVVDYLEHVTDERRLIEELRRVLKPDGVLLINVPYWERDGLLRRIQKMLGQTDEKHGHLRPGYSLVSLERALGDDFEILAAHRYSGFCTELVDTMIVFAMSLLKGESKSQKGLVVTGQDMAKYRSAFRAYSLVYPIFRIAALIDHLLLKNISYKLLAKARIRNTTTVNTEVGAKSIGVR
ncbi:MAG: class I SAM-dependent methyltransferase [Aggregatilineales bacterium]